MQRPVCRNCCKGVGFRCRSTCSPGVTGDPHEQSFDVTAVVRLPAGTRGLAVAPSSGVTELRCDGAGTSRRRAEQAAAQRLLEQLTGTVP